MAGNRISKAVTPYSGGTAGIPLVTWYVRDASGNVMSIYSAGGSTTPVNNGDLSQVEIPIYGSSRLGEIKPGALAVDVQNGVSLTSVATSYNLPVYLTTFTRGIKFFELGNHLGNVLVTVSDKKIGVDANNDGTIDSYNADVVSANDYYPGGMLEPGRQYTATGGTGYRYGFNGKEQDGDIDGTGVDYDYGFRIYDARVGRFLSVDPLTTKYPMLSPYQFCGNDPINGTDMDGLEFTKEQINAIRDVAVAYLKISNESLYRPGTAARGFNNAIVNAESFGISDRLPDGYGTNNLGEYKTSFDKSLSLAGRLVGDAAAALQGATEVGGGTGSTGAGLAVSASGIGIVAGGPAVVGGLVVAGHGALVGQAAAIDMGWALKQLQLLNVQMAAAKDAGNSGSNATNSQASAANGGG